MRPQLEWLVLGTEHADIIRDAKSLGVVPESTKIVLRQDLFGATAMALADRNDYKQDIIQDRNIDSEKIRKLLVATKDELVNGSVTNEDTKKSLAMVFEAASKLVPSLVNSPTTSLTASTSAQPRRPYKTTHLWPPENHPPLK